MNIVDKPPINDIVCENFRVGISVLWEKVYLINSVYTIGYVEEKALDPLVVPSIKMSISWFEHLNMKRTLYSSPSPPKNKEATCTVQGHRRLP